jgi:hypothetical protein
MMSETQRKYKSSLTFGKLETALEAHEMLFGTLIQLEAIDSYTVATFEDSNYPALATLALMPLIGGNEPPPPNGATHLFNGQAMIMDVQVGLSVFRTT